MTRCMHKLRRLYRRGPKAEGSPFEAAAWECILCDALLRERPPTPLPKA